MLVYKATNLLNNKSYIGKTVKTLRVRRLEHENAALRRCDNCILHKALRKYGADNFQWEIIAVAESQIRLSALEAQYIEHFDTFRNGYNSTIGGEGTCGFRFSDMQKEQLSQIHRGKHLSRKHRDSISRAVARRWINKDSRSKLIAGRTRVGRFLSDEAILKRNQTSKSRNIDYGVHRRGTKLDEEHRQHIAQGHQKKSKLSWEDVAVIRSERAKGTALKTLAAKFHVTAATISDIANYKTWKT
jgi:group I intron endonuclease